MSKFYNFKNETEEAVDLFINGEIVDDDTQALTKAWLGVPIGSNPGDFLSELKENAGKMVNVYIDSYGGDVFAASSIYSALKEHKGGVTVKITGVAASAASVIAMAGDKVLMSKTAVIMIHNPACGAWGDHNEMAKTIEVLDKIKDSIINAYEAKTGLSREEISDLMEKETWMTYDEAMEKKFCDGLIEDESEKTKDLVMNCIQNRMFVYNSLYGKKQVPQNSADPVPTEPVKNEDDVTIHADAAREEQEKMAIEQESRYADLLMKK